MKSPLILLILCVLSTIGCSQAKTGPKDRTEVSGNVTLNGEPLAGGTITFMLDSDPNVRVTSMVENGQYRSNRIPVGKCKVAIETESLKLGSGLPYTDIPKQYTSFNDSGFTADIVEGTNEGVDFALQK